MTSANIYSIRCEFIKCLFDKIYCPHCGCLHIQLDDAAYTPYRVGQKERADIFYFELQTLLHKISQKLKNLILINFMIIFPSYSVKLMRFFHLKKKKNTVMCTF